MLELALQQLNGSWRERIVQKVEGTAVSPLRASAKAEEALLWRVKWM